VWLLFIATINLVDKIGQTTTLLDENEKKEKTSSKNMDLIQPTFLLLRKFTGPEKREFCEVQLK
jgi:hypothetical protein